MLNLTFLTPGNKEINVKIDGITQVKHLLANLKMQENGLEPSKAYVIHTKSGTALSDTSMFKDFKESEYIIRERVESHGNGTLKPGAIRLVKNFHQLGILVLDGSESMTWMGPLNMSKGKHVSGGVAEMFQRFEKSRVKQNFSFACINFDHEPTTVLHPSAFDYSALMKMKFDPTDGKGGGTCIYSALEEAYQMATDFLEDATPDGLPMSVLILLMSDGECSDPDKTKAIANSIKNDSRIQIACAFFSEVGKKYEEATDVLKAVASDFGNGPQYTEVIDGTTLREFFLRTVTQSTGAQF